MANAGQLPGPARFYLHGSRTSVYFEPRAVVLDHAPEGDDARGLAVRVDFPGSRSAPRVEGGEPAAAVHNEFVGSDRRRWRSGVRTYREIRYRDIAPGADIVYRLEAGGLKYDVELAPGAAVSAVRLRYRGIDRLEIADDGSLRLHSAAGVLAEAEPLLYQERDGGRTIVPGGYRLLGANELGFWAGDYDRTLPLIVDPAMKWSTFIGGSGNDVGYAVACDGVGDVYVVGTSASTNYPTTNGAYQRNAQGGTDVVVTKLRGDGSGIVWSTRIGGGNNDDGRGVAVDAAGSVYVCGNTMSGNFPTTSGAFKTTHLEGDIDGFVTKLAANGGALVYSTLLGGGGSDYPNGLAVGAGGVATVVGHTGSTDFPVTAGVVRTTRNPGFWDAADVFVTRLNESGSALIYSTYLGTNSGTDVGYAIAVDAGGQATVVGRTLSTFFPTTAGAFSTTAKGDWEAFVTRLNPTATGYVYSTFLAGVGRDEALAVCLDSQGNAYVAGMTASSDFPVTGSAYQRTYGGGNDAFVTKLNANGSALLYSSFLGGGGWDSATGICISPAGHAAVTGVTGSANFPIAANAHSASYAGSYDAFLSVLSPAGSALSYSSFFGGSALEQGRGIALRPNGHVVFVGDTQSGGYPTTAGAFSRTHGSPGVADFFLTSVDVDFAPGSTVSVGDRGLPAAGLSSAWPNPFRDQTSVEMTLAHATPVSVRIHDARGRLVRVLADQELGPGRQRWSWDGRDNAGQVAGSGVYLIRVNTPEGWESRTVVRLK